MTKEDLTKVRELSERFREQAKEYERLVGLYDEAAKTEARGFGTEPDSEMLRISHQMVDTRLAMAATIEQRIQARQRLVAYINGLQGARIKKLLEHRLINCLSWEDIACHMGTTTETVRWAYENFVAKNFCE